MWSKVACSYAAGVENSGWGGGAGVSGRRGGQRGGVEEEPTGLGDLTVWPVCGFQTPRSYLPLGFRTLYKYIVVLSM